MNIAETGGRSSIATSIGPSPSFECRASPMASPISSIKQAEGKKFGENPFFSNTTELKAETPQTFDSPEPEFSFLDTQPFKVEAQPFKTTTKTELRELLDSTRLLAEPREPVLDFAKPGFNLRELEVIAKAQEQVQEATEEISLPNATQGLTMETQEPVEIPIEGPNLASILELDTQSVAAENVEPEILAASQKDELVLLEKYLELYSTQTSTEKPKVEKIPSPLVVEDGEVKFNIQETVEPAEQNSNPNAGSFIEVQLDLKKARDVEELLIRTGAEPQEAETEILTILREKWVRTGLHEQIIELQKPLKKDDGSQEVSVKTEAQADGNVIIEEDPAAQQAKEDLAKSALTETVEEVSKKKKLKDTIEKTNQNNIDITGSDLAGKISTEQTSRVKGEIVKFPIEREDGSYKPWRQEIATSGKIGSIEEGNKVIKEAGEHHRTLRAREQVTTIKATPKEIQEVLGETIVFERIAA